MSGHSKWAKLKHFKGAIDAKRARIFAKLSRELAIAARLGGGDPDMNPRLRMAVLKCRSANMPSENIERAIKKGAGSGETANYEDMTYEVFGPGGVAMLVEVSTDNRNRTASEIRALLARHGGTMATSGAVSRLFQRKGQMIIPREAASEDQVMEAALDAGAEDFRTEAEVYEVITEPAQFEAVHTQLQARGIKCASAEVAYLPAVTAPVADSTNAAALSKLIEALEDRDDVKELHTNADLPEELG
jgi:YebC/PmpR family DNA-binding regulatory protein